MNREALWRRKSGTRQICTNEEVIVAVTSRFPRSCVTPPQVFCLGSRLRSIGRNFGERKVTFAASFVITAVVGRPFNASGPDSSLHMLG